MFALACSHTAAEHPPESAARPAAVVATVARSFRIGPDSSKPEIAQLVSRLELERYKATIKRLTQFGDRRQGTDRNRAAVDWI